MCGIVGAVDFADAESRARKSLERINYRGVDGKDFYADGNVCFGHCLHSVVGNTQQPIVKGDFVLGANCEIYNWKELAAKYKFDSKNDAELLLDLLMHHLKGKPTEKMINKVLKALDGVFAFFLHKKKGYTLLCRDVIGVKPLWFSDRDGLMFASEGKAIEDSQELNPRKILYYDKKVKFFDQEFFSIKQSDIGVALSKALEKRIPDRKLGILFSGGIDSTLLAFMLTKLKVRFTAYMTVCEKGESAEKIAKKLGFPLKIIRVSKKEVMQDLPKVMKLIESTDPVKVEVGLTMHAALKEAGKDGIKVIFSGVGADDIFGGYRRMHGHGSINEDCLSNLRRLYEKDLYRDDVLAMANNIELRLPYLDKELVEATLGAPKDSEVPKMLLRQIAMQMGLPEEMAMRRRVAAQYGSGMSRLVTKIIKENKARYKGAFFSSLYPRKNIKVGVLFSSGKDCTYAMHIQHRLNYEIACLVSIESKNKDSFMFHTPSIALAPYQAEALGLPLVLKKSRGVKEAELEDLKKALLEAKNKHKIQGVVTGAIYSNYQRSRIERICDELNLKVYSPLWHVNQETEMKNLIDNGYDFVMAKVAADGLDKSWLGRSITHEDLARIIKLHRRNKMNIAGEGGEFESFVLDAPLFKKRLEIVSTNVIEDRHSAELIINEVRLIDK